MQRDGVGRDTPEWCRYVPSKLDLVKPCIHRYCLLQDFITNYFTEIEYFFTDLGMSRFG